MKLVIGRRLERVSADCRAVLAAAAVIGPRFDLKILEALGELSGDAILDALDSAERAGLIQSQSIGRDTRYVFAHELIRQTLLGTLSMPRRQRRHQRTAEAIEKVYGNRVGEKIADLAYHLFQAGAAVETDRTTHALLVAGRQALAAGAFDEARSHIERALSIVETENDLRHAELLRVRAAALKGAGDWDAAARDFEVSVPRLRAFGASNESAAALLEHIDILNWTEGDHVRTAQMLRDGIDSSLADPVRARLLVRGGISIGIAQDYDAGRVMVEDGVRLAHASGEPAIVAECVAARGSLAFHFLKLTAAVRDLAFGVTWARENDRSWELARFGALLARAQGLAGEPDASLATNALARKAASEIGHIGAAATMALDASDITWLRSGDTAMLLSECERVLAQNSPALLRELALCLQAFARLEMDEPNVPMSQLEGATERASIMSWRDFAWGMHFRLAAYRTPASALSIFNQYSHRIRSADRATYAGVRLAIVWSVEALAVLGEHARAAELYPHCAAFLEDGGVGSNDPIETQAAIAAACGAEWKRAEGHFANALAVTARLPHVPAQVDTRRWYAWMLLRRGATDDRSRARALLGEAIAIASRYQLRRRERLARELLTTSLA